MWDDYTPGSGWGSSPNAKFVQTHWDGDGYWEDDKATYSNMHGVKLKTNTVAQTEPLAKTDGGTAYKWESNPDYMVDSGVVSTLKDQLQKQQDTLGLKYQTGADTGWVTQNMAENLAAAGVQSIYDVGQREVQKEVWTPAATEAQQDGWKTVTVNELYNTKNGQAIPNVYSGGTEGARPDDAWSGTYTGDGNTAYRVAFKEVTKPDGSTVKVPVFYTSKHSSSDMADPGLRMALTMMGGMAAGPAGLGWTGANGSLTAAMGGGITGQALSQGLISGALSGLTGGDPVKGAVSGAIGAGMQAWNPAGQYLGLDGGAAKAANAAASTLVQGKQLSPLTMLPLLTDRGW